MVCARCCVDSHLYLYHLESPMSTRSCSYSSLAMQAASQESYPAFCLCTGKSFGIWLVADGCHCYLRESSTTVATGAASRSSLFRWNEGKLRGDMENGLQSSLLDLLMLLLSGWSTFSNGKQGSLYCCGAKGKRSGLWLPAKQRCRRRD